MSSYKASSKVKGMEYLLSNDGEYLMRNIINALNDKGLGIEEENS